MTATIENQLLIDKSKWTKVKFGDVVFEPKESSKNLIVDGIEHVVGLEHIDTENIHLTRFATLEESTTFTKRFAVGDVLFGRRRAYLKKAAQASFSGVCSGDITVFRSKDNLMPDLLPFIVNNDKFFDYAVTHSAGGLSPRVKFKDLANYEFCLPPKDQQMELAKLLWAMDGVINSKQVFQEKLDVLFRSKRKCKTQGQKQVTISERIKNVGYLPKHWGFVKIEDVFDRITLKNKKLESTNVLTISAQHGLINQEEYFNKSVASKNLTPYYLMKNGDFAYNKSYSHGYPAGAIKKLSKYKNGVVSPLYICFRPKEYNSYVEYYEYLFDSGFLNSQILSVAKEGARNHGLLNITAFDFFNLKLPVPPPNEIEEINRRILNIESRLPLAMNSTNSARNLQKSLINQIF